MILFIITEVSIILASLVFVFGHGGLASKLFNGIFFLIFLAVIIYVIQSLIEKNN